MKIAFFVRNCEGYSGGRYHSWMMAEALSAAGHKVTVVTNQEPDFKDDFIDYPGHQKIKIHLSPIFWIPRKHKFDIVILVPDLKSKRAFYLRARLAAARSKAILIILNFESPNWFNELSSRKKDQKLWKYWLETAEDADLILSISKAGTSYAKKYYFSYKHLQFQSCYPSINSKIADQLSHIRRTKQIIFISTISEHKNYKFLKDILNKKYSGYRLLWIEGTGKNNERLIKKLNKKAKEAGMVFQVKKCISDIEKFFEIYRSKAMIFLSSFEGFGLPPVEAQYCNTPCVAFGLPVLKEVSRGGLHFVERNDIDSFKKKLSMVLKNKNPRNLRNNVNKISSFQSYIIRLERIISQAKKTSPHTSIEKIEKETRTLWRTIAKELIFYKFNKLVNASERGFKLMKRLEYRIYQISQAMGIAALRKRLMSLRK